MNPATTEGTEELEIELRDDELLSLALMAHEQDITLNQLINKALKLMSKLDNFLSR